MTWWTRRDPFPPLGSRDEKDDSSKVISVVLEGHSNVVATTERTIKGETVTREAHTELMGVGRF